jgi:hypothetical protein
MTRIKTGMAEKTNKPKRPEPARTYPESDVWTPPGENPEEIEIDHPVYRKAKPISLGIGAIAALAVVVFTDTPWWMPILTFAVIAAIVYRILRPRMRHPSIEDEI